MPNGQKKIMYCGSCQVKYNVAGLKPGTKFRCQKCGAINMVPEMSAPRPSEPITVRPPSPSQPPTPPVPPTPGTAEPTALAEDEIKIGEEPGVRPAPSTRPVTRPGIRRPAGRRASSILARRSGASTRLSSRFKRGTISSKRLEARGEPGEETLEGEQDFIKVKRSKTPLILGILAVVLFLGIVIYLLAVPKKGEKEETSPEKSKETTEQPVEKPTKKPELPPWKVDKSVLAEVKDIISHNTGLKAKKALVDKGKPAIRALIELINDADKDLGDTAFELVGWITGQQFKRTTEVIRKPRTNKQIYELWKNHWLREGEKGFQYPESVMKKIKAADKIRPPSKSGPVQGRVISGFEANETLRTEIVSILEQMEDQSNTKASEKKIMDKGKEAIPVLILEIGNANDWIARFASDILKKMTKRPDAPVVNPMTTSYEDRLHISREWQRWWLENKD